MNTAPGAADDADASAAALIAQAHELIGRKQFDRALRRFEQAARIEPGDLSIACRIGETLTALNRLDEAVIAFDKVLTRDPASPDARTGLAEIARRQGAVGDAANLYQSVLADEPGHLPATVGLADLFGRAGEVEAAMALFEKAVAAHPRHRELWWAYGDLQVSIGRCADAVESFKRAERIDPTVAETHARLAVAYKGLGRLDEALTCFDRALELWRANWRIHLGRATVLLAQGNLTEGWRGLEWRSKGDAARAHLQPQWNGQALDGQTVFLCGEPTTADEVMFATCLAEFAAGAGRCIVECQPPLAALFARSFPQVEVHAARQEADAVAPAHRYDWLKPLGPIDVYGALGSLPRFLRPTVEAFPDGAGFLTPDPGLLDLWRGRLADLSGKLKLGLWWGGPAPVTPEQALGAGELLTVLDRPDIEFVLLGGDLPRQFQTGLDGPWKDRISVVEGIDPAAEADEAAALIANLDLLVVPPGLAANLAGGLDVPVFVPCQAEDWTHLGTGRMPWFRSMRLFPRHGDAAWSSVLGPLGEAVGAVAGGRPG